MMPEEPLQVQPCCECPLQHGHLAPARQRHLVPQHTLWQWREDETSLDVSTFLLLEHVQIQNYIRAGTLIIS